MPNGPLCLGMSAGILVAGYRMLLDFTGFERCPINFGDD